MRRLVPRRPLVWWLGTMIAAAAVTSAWVIRAALHGLVADQAPYPTFVLAAAFATIFAGWQNGLATAVVGGFLANVSFVAPPGVLHLSGAPRIALVAYFVICGVFIWIMQSFTTSHRAALALNEQLTILGHEYRHRIKNLLAMTQAIIQQTGRYTTDMPEFQDKAVGRLQALARAQDLLLEGQDAGVELRELIERALGPFDIERRLVWPMSGPSVRVRPDSAVALALLLNELATNATKYGAFSLPQGRLKLAWVIQPGWVVIEWRETDGPPVGEPTRRGFGSRLFEQAMPRASGRATLTFEPEGLRCEIRLALPNGSGDAGQREN
ncbi:MAG TPA: sensor histidine kinase [Phenylobacterium sp.]|uniref:sensor histidine kinase n=1 Tax=Phenylobacterium sp. TaxID=1871053 RepID=UPI002B46A324|nr:sensor histidine kinase [Phenylobacterium sp.]HKR88713.1 sensor histidine kinase [Phenylobacterium sp.]